MQHNMLTLNVLNFSHSSQKLSCYITDKPLHNAVKLTEKDSKFFVSYLHFPAKTTVLYSTFDVPCADGRQVTLHTYRMNEATGEHCWSLSFLKNYYTYKLATYFRSKGLPVRTNFISDTEIWVPATSPLKNCMGYQVFRLRVQFRKLSNQPELLMCYNGIHSVFKEHLNSDICQGLNSDNFGWVLHKTGFFRYNDMPDTARRDMENMFLCMNKGLQRALNIPFPAPDKSNRYLRYHNETENFRQQYLQPAMLSNFMLIKDAWLTREPYMLPNREQALDMLEFGNKEKNTEPKNGIKLYGPKNYAPDVRMNLFFICHTNDKPMAMMLYKFLKGEASGFVGVNKYVGLTIQTEQKFSIYFNNREKPMEEIRKQLDERKFETGKRYVAIYLSPYSKWDTNVTHKKLYYDLKEELLFRNIVTQTVEVEKSWPGRKSENNTAILRKGFNFSLPNIAVALLAKLGGTPWGLAAGEERELVIGISAFKSADTQKKYLGSAFCFSGEGQFYGFDCFRESQMNELAGSILLAVKTYCREQEKPDKLIIHFYKTLSRRELLPIEKGLTELGLDIPVVVVSINKTFSEDIIGFDLSNEHFMPYSHTYFPINECHYLLYNTGWRTNEHFDAREGFPFPLKVSVQLFEANSSEGIRPDEETVELLLGQICRFSLLYWKSISRQSLPVTLKYPEMLAQIVPHFTHPGLPRSGRETLWFL